MIAKNTRQKMGRMRANSAVACPADLLVRGPARSRCGRGAGARVMVRLTLEVAIHRVMANRGLARAQGRTRARRKAFRSASDRWTRSRRATAPAPPLSQVLLRLWP